jgi:hypothetical protein
LFSDPLLRTQFAPSLLTPVQGTTWIVPEVFDPVATVMTVDVVFAINAVRMNTDMR